MRLYAISDLHADFAENMALIRALEPAAHQDDAVIIAGDIAHKLEVVGETLSLFRGRFAKVFYTPGNHEYWVTDDEPGDSLDKLSRLFALCDELKVSVTPEPLGRYWIVPLLSWYDDSLSSEEAARDKMLGRWADFRYVRWPSSIDCITEHMAGLNLAHSIPAGVDVISFSHFLPRRDLLPDGGLLKFKGLPHVAGTDLLEQQIRALGAKVHVFGHSHIPVDATIEGVRYVQNPLRYPRERKTTLTELPLSLIADDVLG